MSTNYFDQLTSLKLFVSKAGDIVPGTTRKASEVFPPAILTEARQLVEAGQLLVDKAAWKGEAKAEAAKHQAVIDETETRVRELYHLVLHHAARVPEVEELVKPRIGEGPEAHLSNLRGMTSRIDEHRATLKKARPEFVVASHLGSDATEKQAAAHNEAQAALAKLDVATDATQRQLTEWGAKASRLQSRVNQVLEAFMPGDRGQQLAWGYQERSRARRRSASTDEKPAPAPAPAPTT